jgi:uncharacterized protein (DUF1697 family)
MVLIALIRGVNVVGNNRLPMKSLTALLEKLGCANVRTYLQSGNAVFECAASDRAHLGQAITTAIQKAHGFAPRVMLVTGSEIGRAMRANPFHQAADNHKVLHLFFLGAKPAKADLKALAALAANGEEFQLTGRVFYLYTPNGFGISKLATRAERLLGVDATARNWRTVTSLFEMTRT